MESLPFHLTTKVNDNNLLIHHILSLVEDDGYLKLYRYVCSNWKRLATDILKERNWTFRNFIAIFDVGDLKKYLETFFPITENFLYTCFKIEPVEDPTHEFDLMLNRFFHAFPNSIKSLDFNLSFRSPVQLEDILRSQSSSLEELKINMDGKRSFKSDIDFSDLPNSFELTALKYFVTETDFSTVSPGTRRHKLNIHNYIFSLIPSENKGQLEICIKNCDLVEGMVRLLEKHDLIKNLKFLEVVHAVQGEFELLGNSGVELDFFKVDGSTIYRNATGDLDVNIDLYVDGVYTYLYYRRASLKTLEWRGVRFRFPAWGMSRLTKLKLEFEHGDIDEHGFVPNPDQLGNPILYSEFFPALEELILTSPSCSQTQTREHFQSLFLGQQAPCTHLRKLDVSYKRMNANLLGRLSTLFPRITSLTISHYRRLNGDEQWDFYTTLWNAEFKSTIQKLVITFAMFGNRRLLQRFELLGILSGIRDPNIEQSFTSLPGTNSICNFTNLKHIKLFSGGLGYISVEDYGEESTVSIFAKIPNLEYLYIDHNICKLTADTRNLLKTIKTYPYSTQRHGDRPIEKEFRTEFDHQIRSNDITFNMLDSRIETGYCNWM